MSSTKIRRHCSVFIETKPVLTSVDGGHSALTAEAWQTRSLKSDLPALGCTSEHHSCPKLVGARGRIETIRFFGHSYSDATTCDVGETGASPQNMCRSWYHPRGTLVPLRRGT